MHPALTRRAVAAAEENILLAGLSRRTSFVLILLLIAGTTQVCWAHAILMGSTPALNSTVKGPDFDINLRYNVRIDGGRSRVRLVAPDGSVSTLTLASQASPDTLQTHATGLKPGTYKLQWQVLASDGHMSRGEIPFTVT
jgi:methionine-rich copper-binding protein CopC